MKSYNTFRNRTIIAFIVSVPSYLVLALIQGREISQITFYSYYEYTIAVFLSILGLFELQNSKTTLLENYKSWEFEFKQRLILELLPTFLFTPLIITLAYFIFYYFYWELPIYFPSVILYNTIGIFISLFFMAFVNAGYFLIKWRNASLRTSELEKENLKTQLIALQNQLSPHFLFNNFNILNALIDEDIEIAKKYLHKLSDVFRYILRNKHNEVVDLKDELDFIQNYSFLLKTRFNNKFDLNIDVDQQYNKLKIPPVSLQVLLENALQHNVVSKKDPLQVKIYINGLDIYIVNKIHLKKGTISSTKTGINNISKRYEIITSRKVKINTENGFFSVSLPLIEQL